jgi:beta-phosphoglucomutase-like phosphatase (HAD superfamily)
MNLNGKVEALIFDMDGTMIDSMPWHARSWVEFVARHGLVLDVSDILARTTGRTGAECMRELFERELSDAECLALVHEKEEIYRAMFSDNFTEVAGFTAFARAAVARGLKVAVGTAGDRHNIEFAMSRLKMDPLPLAIVGGDEGFSGKPTPAIFLEAARRGGMRAVAVCSTHSAAELAGPHVIAAVRDYNELAHSNFLETLDAVAA